MITIREYKTEDLESVMDIWNEVVREGIAFPQDEELTKLNADDFFTGQSYTGVAVNSETGAIVGLYILHPNNVGRCGHICNTSYAVKKGMRGLHIGERLVKDSLKVGAELGFRILQFNAVVATNSHALHLYERLGFTQLGKIPQGFRVKEGHYEDIIPHYILLKQIPFYQTRKRNDTERINNIHMDVKQFIQNFRDAFGQKAALPLLFGYSNQPIADTERINGCIFKGLQAAREGVPVSLSAEIIACGGGKLYTGFTDMPERVPGFVSLTEKYKKTPQMVIDYVEGLGMKRAEQTYLNFVRVDKAESFDGFEGIMFYATPDMLSGLCGWAFFDTNAADAVVTQFGSGCSSVVSMTIVENARKGQRCFMGLLDPSVRPYVGTNELSFTIPMSRFKSMTKTMKECFLFDSHAWKKVKARLAE